MVPLIDETGPSSETLAWLLERSDPSPRYQTLTRVLGEKADDPEVRSSREAIPRGEPVRDILLAQYPQGYWMHPGIGYSPRYRATVWQLIILAQLGMARCRALDRAVEHLFAANQQADGAFRASKEAGDTPVGFNGSLLWALETLGYGGEVQMKDAWSWLGGEIAAHGFGGTRSEGGTCSWGAVKALWAANAVPRRQRDDVVEWVSRIAARALLENPPDPKRSDPRWFQLTFPLTDTADVLQWIEVLVDAGRGGDLRLSAARAWLAHKRRPDGTWPLERTPGKLWADFGDVDEPNKWITVRALAASL